MNPMLPEDMPATVSPLARFREYLAQGKLAYQFDPASGQPVFYPRVMAPGSGHAGLEWRVSAGLGRVHAATVIHPRGEPSYNVVLVDMDEGFRLMSRVESIPAEDVRIGLRVRARVHHPGNGAPPHPVFFPEAA